MNLTKNQIKELNRLYQTTCLEKYKHKSIFGGEATLTHHFKNKARALSLRFYVPNGIPLNIEQHNNIHGKDCVPLEKLIIKMKKQKWLTDLEKQQQKSAKYATYDEIKNHILGKSKNYV